MCLYLFIKFKLNLTRWDQTSGTLRTAQQKDRGELTMFVCMRRGRRKQNWTTGVNSGDKMGIRGKRGIGKIKKKKKKERSYSAQRARRAGNKDEVRQQEKGKLSRTCWDGGWTFEAIAFLKTPIRPVGCWPHWKMKKWGCEWRVQGPVERCRAQWGQTSGQLPLVRENSFTMVKTGQEKWNCSFCLEVFTRTPIHHAFVMKHNA